jgi:putative transposase
MRNRFFGHVVWATRNRTPLLTCTAAEFLSDYFARIAELEGAVVIQFGAVQTHVHLLLRLNPAKPLSDLVKRLKGGSAYIGRTEHALTLQWHPGYSIDSVAIRGLSDTAVYVATQHTRHPLEAISGWPLDVEHAERDARRNVARLLDSLDKERYGGDQRGPRGGS